MSVKLVYKDIAVGAAEDAAVTTTDAQDISDVTRLPETADTPPVATGEWNMWLLNGTRKVYANQPIAFWSTEMSGADGTFQTPPTVTIAFDQQYTSLGITLYFAREVGEFCSSVTLKWYKEGELLSSKDYQPDSAVYFCENTVAAYDQLTVELYATSLPYRYARIDGILFGISREFTARNLRSVSVGQEIDLISSALPEDYCDWTLESPEAVDYIFQKKQPVEVYDGSSLVGVYYIESAKRRSATMYDIACVDAIGVLDQSVFPEALYLTETNAKAEIEKILGDSFALEMDAALSGAAIKGYIPECTKREALQYIAFALGAVVDTSGTAKIKVWLPDTGEPAEISAKNTFTGSDVETSDLVTKVIVTAYTITDARPGEGDDSIQYNGVDYKCVPAEYAVESPDIVSTDKLNEMQYKECYLINTDNGQEAAERCYDYHARRQVHSLSFKMNGEHIGDYVTTHTPWESVIVGNITKMTMNFSNITVADAEVLGS